MTNPRRFLESVVVNEDNIVLGKNAPHPQNPARVELRPNRYDPDRANLAVFNWTKQPLVELKPASFLKKGDRYRLMDPRDFFGKPAAAGTFNGQSIQLPVKGEFAALVMLREPQ